MTPGGRFWPNELSKDFCIFVFYYDSSYTNLMDRILSHDALKVNALKLLRALKKWKKPEETLETLGPFIVAHGYGGLICEQVIPSTISRCSRRDWV
jgi:hypothetical protein